MFIVQYVLKNENTYFKHSNALLCALWMRPCIYAPPVQIWIPLFNLIKTLSPLLLISSLIVLKIWNAASRNSAVYILIMECGPPAELLILNCNVW
jgi:hypothetical protein